MFFGILFVFYICDICIFLFIFKVGSDYNKQTHIIYIIGFQIHVSGGNFKIICILFKIYFIF